MCAFPNSGLDDVSIDNRPSQQQSELELVASAQMKDVQLPEQHRRPSTRFIQLPSLASRKLRIYYKRQNELKAGFEFDKKDIERYNATQFAETDSEKPEKYAIILSKITLVLNISLIVAKGIAAHISGSYSVISSVIDSCVDVAAGGVIWLTNHAIRKQNKFEYPRGRSRLEPLAVIIVSIIMGVASILMILESVQAIIEHEVDPKVEVVTLCVMCTTILLKFTLMIFCYKFKSPSTLALAQDHRNDCISCSVAIVCAIVGSKLWIYVDPIGAILVSLYIAITWFFTGLEQIRMLSGRSASSEFISRILKICTEHSEHIKLIDTVLVYHYGTNFLVEVHVVMDKDLSVHEAHDICEPLSLKIESLNYVERCFLHIDYEYEHRPEDEHIQ